MRECEKKEIPEDMLEKKRKKKDEDIDYEEDDDEEEEIVQLSPKAEELKGRWEV